MKLYYYTSAKCALDDFANERIKISKIGWVNDPNEWTPIFSAQNNKTQVPIDVARDFVLKHWGYKYGFVSLSFEWDIAPMWGLYADKYKGVVFEVEANDDTIIPVRYVAHRPICYPIPNEEELRKIIATKSSAWSYEKEVRYLHSLDTNNSWHDGGICFGPMKVISPSCDANIQLERIICGTEIDNSHIAKFIKIRDEYAHTLGYGRHIPIITTCFDQATYAIKEGSVL